MNIRGLVAAGLIGGAALLVPATVTSTPTLLACSDGYYENVDNQCIPGPSMYPPGGGAPAGASAQCQDGSYSS